MPKSTFFNLPLDKRDKILECSKDEFAKHGFYNSSINRIIKEADISRGSFYQYFENKEDLYFYLLNSYTGLIVKDMISKMEKRKYDIFEFQLILFDYMTLEVTKYKDKDFIISAISNMDIKLGNNLMKLTSTNNISISLISMDNIKISTPDEFMALFNILIISLTNELVSYFNNMKDLDSCKKSLINTANLIKYGVLNK